MGGADCALHPLKGEAWFVGSHVLLVHEHDRVILRHLPTLRPMKVLIQSPQPARGVDYSSGANARVSVYRLSDRRLLYTFNVSPRPMTTLSFSPDGRYLALAEPYGFGIWRTDSWEQLLTVPPDDESLYERYRRVFFNADGSTVVFYDNRFAGVVAQVNLWVYGLPSVTQRTSVASLVPDVHHALDVIAGGSLLALRGWGETLFCDFTVAFLDKEVTLFEFGLMVRSFGTALGQEEFNIDADLDGDGEVTLWDFAWLVAHFGELGDEPE